MNRIWISLMMMAIVVGIANGKTSEMVEAILTSTKSATDNCLNIIGMICFWAGIMKIAETTGVIRKISKGVRPLLKFLFPQLRQNEEAEGLIALNMTANLLGLGNIATPLGLNAMKQLQNQNQSPERLTDEMMMMIVLNTASIQIIPTTIIALRASYHSENPVKVVMPILIASLVSVIIGIILVKRKCQKERKRGNQYDKMD